jgi:glycosyltransferase involved in cell wall biosynthesis
MVVAVNTTVVETDCLNNKSNFIKEVFKRIAQYNPQHQFIFIFDKAYDEDFISQKNITPVIITPFFQSAITVKFWKEANVQSPQNALSLKYWYNIKLPLILKKHQVDILIQTAGLCSLTTKIPQLLIIENPANKLQKKHLAQAKKLITNSLYLKNEIITKHQIGENKINVIQAAANDIFKSLSFDEVMQTKDGFADGREYFLLINDGNLISVLKAFSLFKKWQHSNMKLLVVGTADGDNAVINKLHTYKYRDDLVLLNDIDENKLAKLIGSAYCVVYPSFENGFAQPIMQAMQSNVPIITNNTENSRENGGDVALYADSNSFEEIAEKMQLIYKDEILRSKLMKNGLKQANKFSWNKTADQVWETILQQQQAN